MRANNFRRRGAPAQAVLTLVLLGAAAASAAAVPAPPDSALAVVLAELPGQPLRLDEAVAEAVTGATGVRIAEADLDAAAMGVVSEKGGFDPELFADAGWSGADEPSASVFAGADVLETETSTYAAGLRLKTRLGTELSLSANSVRATSNSSFAALDPEYRSFGALTVRQPLLKGFGPAAAGDLAAAEKTFAGAAARREGAVLAARAEAEALYWELYAAERDFAVAGLVRDRAVAFLDNTGKRAAAGLVGGGEVASAEYFLTEAEQALLDSEENLDRASDRLAGLLGRRPDGRRFRTEGSPALDFPAALQDSLVAVALRRNHDLQALARDVDARRAGARAAVWNGRPTLDVLGELGGNGLSGTARDVLFPGSTEPLRSTIDGGRGDALGQATGRDYPTWSVGVAFALPLGNRTGKGELGRARAQVVRAEQQLVAAQRLLEEEVRAQARELERGRQLLEITARGVAASERQVEIGLLEYENGRTTAFEVVRLTADLASAQERYSRAVVRTARAAALLRQLTGGWYLGKKENGS